MTHPLFAAGHKLEPYWLDEAPYATPSEAAVPASADVAVVGAGYTGLSAALTLAREGRSVVVLDAEDAGFGCSSRNGGQCGASLKPGLDGLAGRYGKPRAVAMYREALASLDYLGALIEREQIACHFKRCGRFIGAHAPKQYDALARDYEALRRELGIDCHVVPRTDQRAEIGSDRYYGGGVFPAHAGLQPAMLHRGLLDRARAAGAAVVDHAPVIAVERENGGFTVHSGRGRVAARDVVVATNGYTRDTGAFPALRRRVIPIGSYMIATEPIEPALMDRLMPRDRVMSDSRRVVVYYRASPDRRRILFGGRVALAETDPAVSGPRLHALMCDIFPELAEVGISHSWMGFVGYTFDKLPHVGVRDGMHYAIGYCGSGVAWATYLGHKVARKVIGAADGATAFDDLELETRPFYDGTPWFLAGAVLYYRLLDRFAG